MSLAAALLPVPAREPAAPATRLLVVVLALFLAAPLATRAEVAVPELGARVTDLTGTLSATEAASIERKLAEYEARRGTQVALLMVPTTRPEAIEQYGIRVAERWRLGRAGIDDGALLLVAKDDRELRIEVGYGLEGVLTDATSRRIIDEVIVPRFRDGDFYGGVDAGLDRMLAVIDGEPLPEPAPQVTGRFPGPDLLLPVVPVLLVFAATLGAALKRMLGQLPGSLVTAAVVGVFTWLLIGVAVVAALAAFAAFFITLTSRAGPGRWSSGRRGGYGGGGGGGGGFGGGGGGFRGGGGGFGGGGGSGRW